MHVAFPSWRVLQRQHARTLHHAESIRSKKRKANVDKLRHQLKRVLAAGCLSLDQLFENSLIHL